MYHGKDEKKKKKMVYGGTARKNMMGGGMNGMKRMPKNMGGVANAQPVYSEDMPKAMPN